MSLAQRIRTFKQLAYPKEFRIAAPVWPQEILTALEDVRRALPPPAPTAADSSEAKQDSEPSKEQLRVLAEVGTGLWRIRQKMVQPGSEEPLEEMRRAYRHLESTWDALARLGIEIQDHTGMPFDAGMAIRVIAFQPTPGVDRETVSETIKPSIYYRGDSVQLGEVIVATSEWDTAATASADTPASTAGPVREGEPDA